MGKTYAIYQQVNDLEAIIELIEQAGSGMIKAGRYDTLRQWLDALPRDTLHSRPSLLSLRGAVEIMGGEISEGVSLLNQAVADLRTTRNLTMLARTLVRRSTAHHFLENYQAALADAEEVISLVGDNLDFTSLRAEALQSRGLNLLWLGRSKEAIDELKKSLEIYKQLSASRSARDTDCHNTANVFQDLGLAYRVTGAYQSARECYERSMAYWRETGNFHRVAQLLNNLGMLHYHSGDLLQASLAFNEGLTYARRSGYRRMEAFILTGIGDLYAQLEAPEAAQEAYCQARNVARRINHRSLLLHLDLAEVALARSQGDLLTARNLLASALERAGQESSAYETGLCQLEAGRIALAENKSDNAVRDLTEAVRLFREGNRPVDEYRTLLCLSHAHYSNGEMASALLQFENLLRQASSLESTHFSVPAGCQVKAFLEHAHTDPTVGRYASQLLNQIKRFTTNIPDMRRKIRSQKLAILFDPPRLIVQALGEVKVLLDGRLLSNSDWQVLNARDLFLYLIANPEGLT